jgi:uncharacterized membrane protein YphA (DoxX/SURF4 family)
MNRILLNKWFLLVVRIAIGAVFIYAGISKFLSPQQFADSIASFQLLPDILINLLALGLPPTEILAGLMMISGWHWRSANLAILGLTLIFAVALAQGLARGLQVDCGCFGSGKPSTFKTWASLGRDMILIVAASWTYFEFRIRASVKIQRHTSSKPETSLSCN